MTGLLAIALALFILGGGISWILAIFSPSYRKRRRESRAKWSEKLWGWFALLSGIVLLIAAVLDYIGLIEVENF